ncbi:hypothetical protein RFI_31930, partial [Reticulomyxa filosa]
QKKRCQTPVLEEEEKVEETKEEGLRVEQQVQMEIGPEQQRSETKHVNSVNISDSNDNSNNNNNNNNDGDGQLNQMRSGENDDINKDSGNTKEHVMIKHVIRGVETKTEMHSTNNDDGNEEEDVNTGPKEPQKVEDIVAIFNQLNMDELLAQQLAGENLPLVDASSLPHETINTSVNKEYSIVMESAANNNSNDNAETEQDKDTDLIIAMQLEMEETNQMLNTMTNEIGFDYGDDDNENETPSTNKNTNIKKQKQRTNEHQDK